MARGTVNKVILIGRMGSDPEVRYAPSGSPVVNVNIATDHVWKDKEGNLQTETEWHRIVAWNRLAELLKEYTRKGSRIYVSGRLRTRTWQDQNGQTRYTTEIIANEIQLLDSRADAEGGGFSDTTPLADTTPPEEDTDITPDENVPF
ncbi:MAG: single-stranded DNA-binding protein [Calditrichaeota bacterium]|nr:MAG: single-stranded DNA-binding protein [Calditrichota bacterium]